MFGWGNTVNGELGLGGIEEEHILIPKELPFRYAWKVVLVGCGENHTVMVLDTGAVYTCGNNDHNQLGHDKSWKKPESVDALGAHVIQQVACGSTHTLVANEWGQVFSWGSNSNGQLGHGNNTASDVGVTPRMVKSLATRQVVQIACGANHSMALTNTGQLYIWGSNHHGQLGLGMHGNQELKPSLVKSLQGVPISLIACGSNHSCVLSPSGALFCWGKNTFGQLGTSDTKDRDYPTLLRSLRPHHVKHVSCGEDHTAVLTNDGGVFTFGAGMYGQLGHNSTSNEILPRKVIELMGSVVTQVSCGRRHTLAYVPSRGKIYSFGLGGSGQLGVKSKRNSTIPITVYGPWVSPTAPHRNQVQHTDRPDKLLVVYHIFTGGDHCFVRVTLQKDEYPSKDFRIWDPQQQILTLTEEKANEFLNVGEKDSVAQELMSYIENTFSSQSCINASFLLKNNEHYGCSRTNHGVDMHVVRQFFHKISKIKNPVLQELINNCQEKELIPELSPSPPDVEALRLYLILPECHLFRQPSNFSNIICPFGHVLVNLRLEAGKIIASWWGLMDEPYFLNAVQVYKACIVHILSLPDSRNELENLKRTKGIETSMKVLEKLNWVNKERDYIVSYETFNIPEITQKIDVRVDYLTWLQYGKMLQKLNNCQASRLYFCNYPFVFDASAKTLLLQTDADLQMQSAVDEAYRHNLTSLFMATNPTSPFLVLYVTRENIVHDTVSQLAKYGSTDFKKPLKVIFCDEEAVDLGGVRKEFFMLLLKEILDPKFGMFKEFETYNIWFNEQSFEDDVMFHLIGSLCGLAIYNGTIIALPFPLVLYKKLLKEKVKLENLKDLSPTLVKGLVDLMNYNGDDVADVFMLQFEITRDVFGEMVTTELKPGGSQIAVTNENSTEYVDLYVDFILNKSVDRQFQEFYHGFHKVCGGRVLELFHAQELMEMVIGNENYNWKELEENTEYKEDYHRNHPTIRIFWRVFHSLSIGDKKKYLLFLTGSDRIPILGMKSVKMYIQPSGGGDEFLPVAHTCFNLLDLPRYTTEEQLRAKLLQAIEHTQGFGLV